MFAAILHPLSSILASHAVDGFLSAFIPLFVAIDPLGMVPVFLGVTSGLDGGRRRAVTLEAVGAALAICLGFMFLGNVLFRYLGIDANDFKIAGGVLLLVLAILDLVGAAGKVAVDERHLSGIVPLATPLIAGPATLTTVLVLAAKHGYALTSLSIAANLAILLVAMLAATRVARVLGVDTMRALSKLVMILLAAIAVNFIRSGVMGVLHAAAAAGTSAMGG
jgi:multiple antibiotic resistance protein